jgi:hypothetical protein
MSISAECQKRLTRSARNSDAASSSSNSSTTLTIIATCSAVRQLLMLETSMIETKRKAYVNIPCDRFVQGYSRLGPTLTPGPVKVRSVLGLTSSGPSGQQ